MVCDKYKGFIPLKRAVFLWEPRAESIDPYKVIYRPHPEDYNIESGTSNNIYEYDLEEYISRSNKYTCSDGCVSFDWEELDKNCSLSVLLCKFFESNMNKQRDYLIEKMKMKSFLYELGKIKEFKEIRRLRYWMFVEDIDPPVLTFEEYQKEIWSYEYCHPVLY